MWIRLLGVGCAYKRTTMVRVLDRQEVGDILVKKITRWKNTSQEKIEKGNILCLRRSTKPIPFSLFKIEVTYA